MTVDQNVVGQCGEGQLEARNKIMDRYYPDWIDNNFSTQKLMQRLLMSFKEHSRIRRLELIEQEEDDLTPVSKEREARGMPLQGCLTWNLLEQRMEPTRVHPCSPSKNSAMSSEHSTKRIRSPRDDKSTLSRPIPERKM